MPENVGMIPAPANPYQEPNHVRPYEAPEPAVVTMRDLDRLVGACLADERRAAAERQRRACLVAWEEGRRHGRREGEHRANEIVRAQVERIVRGRLNHIVRHLQNLDRPKATINHERNFMVEQSAELVQAIKDLEDVGREEDGGQFGF